MKLREKMNSKFWNRLYWLAMVFTLGLVYGGWLYGGTVSMSFTILITVSVAISLAFEFWEKRHRNQQNKETK